MEDFLILLLQGIAQFVLEVLAYGPWDLWWYDEPTGGEKSEPLSIGWWMVISFLFGSIVGGGSLYFFPDVLVKWGWLRIALLVISPLISGLLALRMAQIQKRMKDWVEPSTHFWLSCAFSCGLVWVRFAFAHRPGW